MSGPAGVLKTGYLEKKHGPFNKWARRYYVLTENALLRCKRTDRDSYFGKEVARYYLDKMSMIEVCPESKEMFEFCVKEGGETNIRVVKASNEEEANAWVKAILLAKKKRARILRRESTRSPIPGKGAKRKSGRPSVTGEYFQRQRQNSIFGPLAPASNMPSPFHLIVQQADGASTKGNSLVPTEELCVGVLPHDAVFVVEDTEFGRTARIPARELEGIAQCERELNFNENDADAEDLSHLGAPASCKLRFRFYHPLDGDAAEKEHRERLQRNSRSLLLRGLPLFLPVLVAAVASNLLEKAKFEGRFTVWGIILLFALYLVAVELAAVRERKKQMARASKRGEHRICYVALLDDDDALKKRNEERKDRMKKNPVWNWEAVKASLAVKDPLEQPHLLMNVPVDKETPPRFLRMGKDGKQDAKFSRKRWRYTSKWRQTHSIDRLLEIPHVKYDVIKPYYNCYYYGWTREVNQLASVSKRCDIFIDQPGGVDVKQLEKAGCSMSDLVFHYIWITEYLWQKMHKGDDDAMGVTIYDLSKVSLSLTRGQMKELITASMKLFEQHYPERTYRIYIVNGPWWFNRVVWPIAKSIADAQTLEKIFSFPSPHDEKFKESISEIMDLSDLPEDFGGTNPTPLDQSKEEIEMGRFARRVCKDMGVEMLSSSEKQMVTSESDSEA